MDSLYAHERHTIKLCGVAGIDTHSEHPLRYTPGEPIRR